MHHRTAADYEKLDREMDYEEKSLPAKMIVIWVGGLLAGLLMVMGLMYLLLGVPKAVPRPDMVTNRKMLMPALQNNPRKDLKVFKKEQAELLTTYGWVDKSQGIVRLPIEVAMDLAIQRGMFSSEGKK
jgi:hypothetical protein